ncbi:hypothetical protein OESDEN_13088, partial [Oesophagostomum dentatum]
LAPLAENDNEDVFQTHSGTRSLAESSDVTPVPSSTVASDDPINSVVELSTSGNLLHLDVDARLPFGRFKAWLGRKLGMDTTQFVVIKHYREDDKGYECNNKDDESVRNALENVFKLGVKLRPPLKDDEKLIRVL